MELLIVIIILGLLAAVVLPGLMGKGEKAKRDLVCIQMNSIKQALDMFKMDNGLYPETEEGLEALVTNPDSEKYNNYSGNYFDNGIIPKDSWKHKFIYIYDGKYFELISYGADKKEGGIDEAKDIKYSECIRK